MTADAAAGWLLGGLTGLVGWGALGLVWIAVRRATAARNLSAWGWEWERVEPGWSGRVR